MADRVALIVTGTRQDLAKADREVIRWLAFPKGPSPGTRDCARKCEAAGFTGQIVELEP